MSSLDDFFARQIGGICDNGTKNDLPKMSVSRNVYTKYDNEILHNSKLFFPATNIRKTLKYGEYHKIKISHGCGAPLAPLPVPSLITRLYCNEYSLYNKGKLKKNLYLSYY